MDRPPLAALIFAIAVLIVLAFFIGQKLQTQPVPENLRCEVDSDCVPAQCCHAISGINKDFAPDCKEIVCSQECEPNTLDCNQGAIKCVSNKCTLVVYGGAA